MHAVHIHYVESKVIEAEALRRWFCTEHKQTETYHAVPQ